jgi:hypothetical protein
LQAELLRAHQSERHVISHNFRHSSAIQFSLEPQPDEWNLIVCHFVAYCVIHCLHWMFEKNQTWPNISNSIAYAIIFPFLYKENLRPREVVILLIALEQSQELKFIYACWQSRTCHSCFKLCPHFISCSLCVLGLVFFFFKV